MVVSLSCSHTFHTRSLFTAAFHWYKPCKSTQPARRSPSPVLFPVVDACSLLSTSPLRGEFSWVMSETTRWDRAEEMTTKSRATFSIRPPPLLWEQNFLETQHWHILEAPDSGGDGYPGGWPWGWKGPLADGRGTLKATELVWDAAQLKRPRGAVIITVTAQNGPPC